MITIFAVRVILQSLGISRRFVEEAGDPGVAGGAHEQIGLGKVGCIEVQVRHNSDPVFDVVKDEHGFGKAEDGQWQPKLVFLRNGTARQ